MIDWNRISDNTQTDELLAAAGALIKQRFLQQTMTESTQLGLLDDLVDISVAEAGEQSARQLTEAYRAGHLPRFDDSRNLGSVFVRRFLERAKALLCAELLEDEKLSDDGHDLVVALVPAVIVVLSLPAEYSAIAAPIAAILAKRGIKSFCREARHEKKEGNGLARLEAHRAALDVLLKELEHFRTGEVPADLERAILRQRKAIAHLEAEERQRNK